MIYYKVRRKSNGKFAGGRYYAPSWGKAGKTYSLFLSAVHWFNSVGWSGRKKYSWDTRTVLFSEIELIRYDNGIETIIWTDSKCPLKEPTKILPNDVNTNKYNLLEIIGCAFYYSENPGIDKAWQTLPLETKNEMTARVQYIITKNKPETMGDITILEIAKVIGLKVK